MMGHQGDHPKMEVVITQALRHEAGKLEEVKQHTGCFLLGLKKFCGFLFRPRLRERARSMGGSIQLGLQWHRISTALAVS